MKTVCIKIGGSTVDAEGLLRELGRSIRELLPDVFPIIIHGGGKEIARHLKQLNRKFTFIEGMRVTDAKMVKVVQMVLSGDINKKIVNALIVEGVNAVGFSGIDASLFTASRMLVNGKDIGLVGRIDAVSPKLIDTCRSACLTPVISPISRDSSGCIYNVNADLAASELAMAIKADDLIFVSDVPGVLVDDVTRKEIRTSEIETLVAKGHVTGGMVPKLRSAADAVHHGVKRVHICGWNDHSTLGNELSRSSTSGTVIYH